MRVRPLQGDVVFLFTGRCGHVPCGVMLFLFAGRCGHCTVKCGMLSNTARAREISIINFAGYCKIYRAGKLIQYIFSKRDGFVFRRNYRKRDVFEKCFVLCNEVFGF